MNRRTFGLWLSGLVAAFLGLLGLRWRPKALQGAQGVPVAPVEPVDVVYGSPVPEEVIETDLYEMLDHIVDHVAETGETVLCFDDPMTRRLGWTCETKSWQISLTKLKASMDDRESPHLAALEGIPQSVVLSPEQKMAVVKVYLPSTEGRAKLAAAMTGAGLARRRRSGVS